MMVLDRILRWFGQHSETIPDTDCVTVHLPPHASMRSFRMLRDGGRDQVAALVDHAGWAAYEPPLPLLFFHLAVRARGLIVDVGANTGFYALLAAAASKFTRVLAFEPDIAVQATLRHNLALNRMGRRIVPVDIALSDRAGRAALYVPTQEHGLIETSSSLEQDFKTAHSAVLDVAAMPLDSYLAGTKLGRAKVSLMKIDVEGHEAAVLSGCTKTVARHRPIIFAEILPRAELARLQAFIDQHGYASLALPAGEAPILEKTLQYQYDSLNHAFVPRESVSKFLETLRVAA
jgi:FkbM family methyltransferase